MSKPDKTSELFSHIREAAVLEHGPTKCSLLEELVRVADTHQDLDAAFEARIELINAATFSGYPEKSLVAFSWCLAQKDREPDRFAHHDLLWKYKWVVNSLSGFPQISNQQIEDMLQDMQRRYDQAGIGSSAVLLLRWRWAMSRGDDENLKKYYQIWRQTSRDRMSDCPACERNLEVSYATFFDEDERALELAEPILQGRLKCAEVPHITYGSLLYPLARLGRLDEAVRMYRIGYRYASKHPGLLGTLAEHLVFLGLTDNLPRGCKLFERHLPWALDAVSLGKVFSFYRAARFLMECMRIAGKDEVKLRLPKAFPLYQEKGRYAVAELYGWLVEQTDELARRFDARNGTDYYARRIRNIAKLHASVMPHPFR